MTSPHPHKPTPQDAFTPLPPPPGGLARLRAALDAQASSPQPLSAWLRPPVIAAAVITACTAALLWSLLPNISPNPPPHPSPAPLTVVLISSAPSTSLPPQPQDPFTLSVDPLWQASLPLPDNLLRPRQTPHLLPIPLSDDTVAFYWAESPIPSSHAPLPASSH